MISVRYSNFISLLVLISIGSIFFPSCSYFTEPKLSNNDKAKPIQYLQYAHISYQKDTLCGGIFIRFKPEGDATGIKTMNFFIDSLQVFFTTSTKYEYFFDTRSYKIGKHDLKFIVYENNSDLGLMNMFGYPNLIYSTTLIFAENPIPSAPTNARKHWNSQQQMYLTWDYSPSPDSIPEYFIIERTGPTRLTDTIYNIQSRYYVDTTWYRYQYPDFSDYYKLGAANRYGINFVDCGIQQ